MFISIIGVCNAWRLCICLSFVSLAGPPIPPGHPSMLSSTPPLHPPAPAPMAGPPAPPPPPGPPPPAAVPPPNPPPLPAPSGLAAALAGAKLRKVQRVSGQCLLSYIRVHF